MRALGIYFLVLLLLVVAYVMSYEPVGKMQVELFELMKKGNFVDHYEYPSTMEVTGVRPIPLVTPLSVDGSSDNQHVSGWKLYWKDNQMKSQVGVDTSFEGTSYMDYSKKTPLLYDGVRI